MKSEGVFDKFCQVAPFAVMTRCLAQHFISTELDQVFEDHRSRQYERDAKFSAVALAVADVTLNFCDNFNQAYRTHREALSIAVTSFYDKISATEPSISEAVVAFSFEKARSLQAALGYQPWQILPGYKVLAFDGNHLAKTDKRLKVLHDVTGAPLPGTVVARYDLQRELFEKAYVLEDAHAQESSTCNRIVADLNPREVAVADRHFCIVAYMVAIAGRSAAFIIRQHGRLKGVLLGNRRRIGRVSSGVVYEQAMRLSANPNAMIVRRITIELTKPTRDGETVLHILTNLPEEIDAMTIADVYRLRWDEETAFYKLQMTLTCELASVSHPRAALFLFCMSMLAYNMRQVIFAALYAEHDAEKITVVSDFHLSVEVARYTDGMLVALDQAVWDQLIPQTDSGLATLLRNIGRSIDLRKYKKHKRPPKIKKPIRSRNTISKHVSTAKLLREASEKDP